MASDRPPDSVALDAKESFHILRELLKDYSATYVSYTITTSASILLVIGWLLTSDKARDFIGGHGIVRWPLTAVAVVLLALEALIGHRMMRVTTTTARSIEQLRLPGVLPVHYEPRMISRRMVYSYLAAHALMYGFLLFLVWLIPDARGGGTTPSKQASAAAVRTTPGGGARPGAG
jgi:hypothetical protein